MSTSDHRRMEIYSFYETRPELILEKLQLLGIDALVVPQGSALMNTANEIQIGLDHFHTELCKPIGYHDMRYKPLQRYIQNLIRSHRISEKETEKRKKTDKEKVVDIEVTSQGKMKEVPEKTAKPKPKQKPKFDDRKIDYKVKGKLHKRFKNPWTYKCTARDAETGTEATVRGLLSDDGAREHAAKALKVELQNQGIIQ